MLVSFQPAHRVLKPQRFGNNNPVSLPDWEGILNLKQTTQTYATTRNQLLQQHWSSLMTQLGIPQHEASQAFKQILQAYESPSPVVSLPRDYHSLDHLTDCLSLWDAYKAQNPPLPESELVELGLWFHDIVDERNHKTGVDESADAAVLLLQKSTLQKYQDPGAQDTLRGLIMATKYGAPSSTPLTLSQRVLTDIDLSILGRSPKVYQAYVQAIRNEYAFVPKADYPKGRIHVLEMLLKRVPLYQTPWGQQQFEANARVNVNAEIQQLKSLLGSPHAP